MHAGGAHLPARHMVGVALPRGGDVDAVLDDVHDLLLVRTVRHHYKVALLEADREEGVVVPKVEKVGGFCVRNVARHICLVAPELVKLHLEAVPYRGIGGVLAPRRRCVGLGARRSDDVVVVLHAVGGGVAVHRARVVLGGAVCEEQAVKQRRPAKLVEHQPRAHGKREVCDEEGLDPVPRPRHGGALAQQPLFKSAVVNAKGEAVKLRRDTSKRRVEKLRRRRGHCLVGKDGGWTVLPHGAHCHLRRGNVGRRRGSRVPVLR
mmetsp:Transcript_12906/g.30025  ORF Transcript_12906/g.30025 Transcript_12906/m.30025 type:complete len:263 (-) Transcript_12906:1445-2233(-)